MPGDVVADRVNELYRGEIFDNALQRTCQNRIHWICAQVTGDDVLDVGCSQGIISLILGREGHRVVGVDVDPRAIDYALSELDQEPEYVRQNVKFSLVGGEGFPFDDESFDTIVLGQILEHLTRPDRVLREARRLLRPTGRVVITTPFGVHPHPGHVRTFYLAGFLGTVAPFFRIHTLQIADGYINCVGVRAPVDSEEESQAPSWEKLLLLSEESSLAKEQQHWEHREGLARQAKSLREDLAKATTELDSLRRSAAESVGRLRVAEQTLAQWNEALLAVLDRVREILGQADGSLGLGSLLEQTDRAVARLKAGQPAEGAFGLLDQLVAALLRSGQEQVLSLSRQHEARTQAAVAELRRQHEAETARMRADFERQSAALKEAHQQELHKARQLQANAERLAEQLRARVHSLVEYNRVTEELHREQVRYRIGDAFVRAFDSPKDLVCLPGRLVKLVLAGRRRRREREGIESPPAEEMSSGSSPVRAAARPAQPAPVMIETPVQNPSTTATKPKTPAPAASPARPLGAEVFEKAPFAPHLGTGRDPRETVFARPPGGPRRRVAAIFDEFSRGCFEPEMDLVTFRPDNWANVLKVTGADLLLVESAWHGNDGSWQYRIASYPRTIGGELADLVAGCKRNGVPTVFWNKEDPSHFDRFIDKAGLFDIVLTTDADCIPRYRERLGHDRVYALPFAAQPLIHNPIQTEPRLAKACFAGAWYSDRFDQRRDDMLCLLRAGMKVGLDIYDRMFDAPARDRERYLFPEEFHSSIRGRLPYADMVKAYKRYRVFLNVNSVKDSPTMFSRRVFELLASGTPVVSTYARGIENLLGRNGVFVAQTEAEAREVIETLVRDDEAWARASALGLRKVLSEHTYTHRFDQICRWAGVSAPDRKPPRAALIMPVQAEADFDAAAHLIAGQTYAELQMHLFCDQTPSDTRLEQVRNAAGGRPVHCWSGGGREGRFLHFLDTAPAEVICSVRPEETYGQTYVAEAVMFFQLPGADIIGKACHFRACAADGLSLVGQGEEYRMVTSAPSATICLRRSALNPETLTTLVAEPVFRQADPRILSTYRYGFLDARPDRLSDSDSWCLDPGQGARKG